MSEARTLTPPWRARKTAERTAPTEAARESGLLGATWLTRVAIWTFAGALFVLFAVLSVERNRQMITGAFDLGIFEQEVRSYASFHWPTSSIKGPGYPLLGDHFSPIVALVSPFYWIWPHTETLLVVQSALLAVSVVPIGLWAKRVLSWPAAIVVTGGYGLSWGIGKAAGFDFHEIAFAVPLLALSLAAIGARRYRAALLWALPLVLVKEDLGFTLAVLAGVVAWRTWGLPATEATAGIRIRTYAIAAAVFGVVASAIEFLIVLPALNESGHDAYSGQLKATPLQHITGFLSPDIKIITLVMLLAPTAFLAVRSPLALIAVPTIVWRFGSDNAAYWGTHYHYSAVLMPILFAAFIEGLGLVTRSRPIFLTGSALVSIWLLTISPLHQLGSHNLWDARPKVEAVRSLIAQIPDGATVSATNQITPQLTSRTDVSLVGLHPLAESNPEWAIVDTGDGANYPIHGAALTTWVTDAEAAGYRVVDEKDDVVLLRR